MGLVTVGLILLLGWVSMVVVVLAMCKAAARGDASNNRVRADASSTSLSSGRAERPRRLEQPALN